MRERGSGSLFREKYRDKRTGQVKTCQTWTMKLWVGGRRLKRSAGTTSRAVANKRLEAWKAAIQQGMYVPDAEQTRFDELAALKRMFRLGERAGKVVRRPFIAMLQEHNARTGFFERDQFDLVLVHLPEDLKAVFEADYITGWRVKSEILTRQWGHVDFESGWLRLEPGETKNGEGRQFPLTPALR